MAQTIRIGTRGSRLALWQAGAVRDALAAAHGLPAEAFEITPIRTSGDRIQDRALRKVGGKELFTKEIEEALLSGGIDLAVHSAKDMGTFLPAGLAIGACLEREDPRDVLIARNGADLASLPQGARIGTASLRREALIRRARPDVTIALLRGNVPTRVERVEKGDFDATLLAAAGLRRLGLESHVTAYLPLEPFRRPAGKAPWRSNTASRTSGSARCSRRSIIAETGLAVACERAFLAALGGSCETPVAAYAQVAGDRLRFDGIVLSQDGREAYEAHGSGSAERCRRDRQGGGGGHHAQGAEALPRFRRHRLMRLIVTRPEPDASRTAQALAALGHAPILSPMLDVVADPAAALPKRDFQAVLVTSGNAVGRWRRIASAGASKRCRSSRSATRRRSSPSAAALSRRARRAGRSTTSPPWSERQLRPGDGPLLHVAGEVVAGDLAGRLAAAGFEVERAVLYRTHARPRLAEAAADALRDGGADGVLLYSRRSAAAFAQALAGRGPGAACRQHRLLLPFRSDRRAASRRRDRSGAGRRAPGPDQPLRAGRAHAAAAGRGLTRALPRRTSRDLDGTERRMPA